MSESKPVEQPKPGMYYLKGMVEVVVVAVLLVLGVWGSCHLVDRLTIKEQAVFQMMDGVKGQIVVVAMNDLLSKGWEIQSQDRDVFVLVLRYGKKG